MAGHLDLPQVQERGHGTLSFDTLTRISLVLGIYKALQVLYPDQSLADHWVRLPNANPIFGGRPGALLS